MSEFLLQAASKAIPSSLWLVSAFAVGLTARRLTPVLLPGAVDAADRLLRCLLLSVVLVAGAIAALGFLGRLQAGWVLGAMVVVWMASRAVQLPDPEHRGVDWAFGLLSSPVTWPWVATAGWLGMEALLALPTAPLNWDALTYHLYFPVRWVQEGQIFHIPAVFADSSVAYAPQNGPLLFAWILSLTESDALCNVVQVLAVLAVMLAVYRIVRVIAPDAGATAAGWAGFLAAMLPPVRRWAYTANVDVLMVAVWMASVSWTVALLCGHGSPRERRGTLGAACLAAGFCAGTKTVGLVLAAPVAVLAVLAWARPQVLRRASDEPISKAAAALVLNAGFGLLLFVVAGGWWYLRNVWLYGNPLFPLDVSLVGLHFEGVYTSAAMKTSRFHIPAWAWIRLPLVQFGTMACVLVALGWLRLAAVRGVGARILALFVPAWCFFQFAVLPYNNQVRFLMPALVVACCGLAPLLAKLAVPRQTGAALGIALLLVVTAVRGTGPYDEILAVAKVATSGLFLFAVLAFVALWSFLVGLQRINRFRASRRILWWLSAVALVALLAVGAVLARSTRGTLLLGMEYPLIVAFEYQALPPLDIAYTGLNVPYMLAGPDFRHRVMYVNTRGEIEDGFFEHWRRDPKLYDDTNLPGIYRGDDDEETWLRRLDRLGIDAVVVYRLLIFKDSAWGVEWPERPGGFPQERGWMRRHPERFKLMGSGEAWEIYLLDAEVRGPSTQG